MHLIYICVCRNDYRLCSTPTYTHQQALEKVQLESYSESPLTAKIKKLGGIPTYSQVLRDPHFQFDHFLLTLWVIYTFALLSKIIAKILYTRILYPCSLCSEHWKNTSVINFTTFWFIVCVFIAFDAMKDEFHF